MPWFYFSVDVTRAIAIAMLTSAIFRESARNTIKYIFSVAGGAAVGAGLGYILPGEKTPLKLMMIGGGGASTWFLHTHKATLGPFRDWGMIASNTALGSGIGWLGCNCHDGLIGGALLGGGVPLSGKHSRTTAPHETHLTAPRIAALQSKFPPLNEGAQANGRLALFFARQVLSFRPLALIDFSCPATLQKNHH